MPCVLVALLFTNMTHSATTQQLSLSLFLPPLLIFQKALHEARHSFKPQKTAARSDFFKFKIGEFAQRILSTLQGAEESILNDQIKQIALVDKLRHVSPFKVGDLVYLNAKDVKFDTSSMFAHKHVGAY
jgi:hypothetical protein